MVENLHAEKINIRIPLFWKITIFPNWVAQIAIQLRKEIQQKEQCKERYLDRAPDSPQKAKRRRLEWQSARHPSYAFTIYVRDMCKPGQGIKSAPVAAMDVNDLVKRWDNPDVILGTTSLVKLK
jgi:hypothetical protein